MRLLSCIALRTVKYSDRANILTVYTREEGRTALLLSASASRESRRRRAMTMPLMTFECIVTARPGRDIAPVADLRPLSTPVMVASHPVKMTVAMFLAEVLGLLLRESHEGDPLLFDFIADAIGRLDRADEAQTANFAIHFLYRLARFVGIEPDASTYQPGRIFDMIDGRFRDSAPLHGRYVEADEARAVYLMSRMTWANYGHIRFSRRQRVRTLDFVLDYYSIHCTSLQSTIVSRQVLTDLLR